MQSCGLSAMFNLLSSLYFATVQYKMIQKFTVETEIILDLNCEKELGKMVIF